MSKVFEPMRDSLTGQERSTSQIIDILKAQTYPKTQRS